MTYWILIVALHLDGTWHQPQAVDSVKMKTEKQCNRTGTLLEAKMTEDGHSLLWICRRMSEA